MPRYFLRLSYLGAPFHGWQRQPNAISVQQVLEDGLTTLLRKETPLTGAGRTDTGVNARMMIAHFDTDAAIPDCGKFLYALNTLAGRNIAVEDVREVVPTAHARFDALSRTYHYYALGCKSPFFHTLAWHQAHALDFDAMNRAAAELLRKEDFSSFAKLHTDTKTNICHVTHAQWHKVDGADDAHVFVITADRFLRNMVRAVVGTLVDVGRGKITHEEFTEIIRRKDRCAAGTSMPGHALYLWDVEYPESIYL